MSLLITKSFVLDRRDRKLLVSKNIQFQHHALLTVQMLEDLRDGSLHAALLPYVHYADGIVSGLHVSMHDDELIVEPGAIKANGVVYMMTEPQRITIEQDVECGVVVATSVQEGWAISVKKEKDARDVLLASFPKRHIGCTLQQMDALRKIGFANYFQAQHVRIASSDGQLTYSDTIAECFARELLQRAGATMSDMAFAWQALQQPPTKTMWQLYLQQNDAQWLDDGDTFVQQLQRILENKKERVVQYVEMTTEQTAKKPAPTSFGGIIVD